MKSMKCQTPYRKAPKPRVASKDGKDSVKVFCRVKPLMNDNETACLRVLSPTTVQMISPEVLNNRGCMYKEIQFTFNEVFCDRDSQKKVFDSVALPLVENLVQGKNSLLFTYGVTGSGKTYTMTGEPEDGGIMPRCIDVIFNSIVGFQSKKYVFKPDKMNGFDVQSEPEAKLERANSLKSLNTPKTPFKTQKKRDASAEIKRVVDSAKVSGVDDDTTYAVFVTYIEIYNNCVYDLLENIPDERVGKGLQNRLIRSDSKSNMYVHAVTELEVTSPQEAFEAFYKGQKRKKMAHTNLNSESSRSHMVFTIRLVQAPLDSTGESALCDKKAVTVSQLSLVDLAGSERTNRTQNTGQRLREAGNINNSLMTLRTCLEILRENQLYGSNKMVPYRDSRITHLFKNFFEGEGQVRVIVCVNPRSDDYDETIHVMKFAEMTQEVTTTKPPLMEKPVFDLLPGRRKANQILKEANQRLAAKGMGDGSRENDIGLVYSLGPPFPTLEMSPEDCEKLVRDLLSCLEMRMQRRVELTQQLHKKQEHFRARLVEIQNEQILSRVENSSLKAALENEKKRSAVLENKVIELQNFISELQRDVGDRENNIKTLSQEVRQLRLELNQNKYDKQKLKLKCSNTIAEEKEKLTRECHVKLKEKEEQLKSEMYIRDEKLRKMQEVLNERYPSGTVPSSIAVLSPIQPSVNSVCPPASNSAGELHLPSVGVLNSAGKYSVTPRSRIAKFPPDPKLD
ncbi:Kinesin-like protein KLP2 [Gryllus bimaculatus]|nr:Kinesin-like protein KLP2 [Gryllus bimaculatus]